MHLSTVRAVVRSATRTVSRVLADAGSAIADGDARFWDLGDPHPLPVPTLPQEASR